MIDAAERLAAERGMAAMSLREVQAAAGQRNKSAAQYHFGSRAGLIEARSCERFAVLRDHLHDRELAEFYGTLFESEARHHSTYVQFAKQFAPEDEVRERLHELSKREAEIVGERDPWVRLHNS